MSPCASVIVAEQLNYSIQKELQGLVAVRESTDLRFLPEKYQAYVKDADKQVWLERRIQELTTLMRER